MSDDIKLTIAVPTAGMVRMAFAYSLVTLVGHIAANGIKTRKEAPVEVEMDVQESSNWITNREMIVRRALDKGRTHLLFIDDDMSFQPQAVEFLFSRRQPVVACNYLIKTDKPEFVAVALDGRRLATLPDSTGIHPIAYTGFGLSLFEMHVFAKIAQPWFLPKFLPESSGYSTEDLPCYERIREAGFPVYLDHDASKLVEHNGARSWQYTDWKPPAAQPSNQLSLIPKVA